MTESKHTQGDWELLPHDKNVFDPMYGDIHHDNIFIHSDGILICDVSNANTWIAPGKKDTHKANARLIAAAPDLLKACKELTAFLYCDGGAWGGYNRFKKASTGGKDLLRLVVQINKAIKKTEE